MDWKIAEAKQRFSEVVRHTAEGPQRICNRDRLVAVMLGAEGYRGFEAWKEEKHAPSMSQAIDEVRRICSEDDYELDLPERRDRANPFAEALDDVPA